MQQLRERGEEEESEGREEALPEGSSAGITGGGDCRRDRRRRALKPALSPPVTPALSSSGNACSHPLSQFLCSPLRSRHVRGSRGRVVLPNVSLACCGTGGITLRGAGGAGGDMGAGRAGGARGSGGPGGPRGTFSSFISFCPTSLLFISTTVFLLTIITLLTRSSKNTFSRIVTPPFYLKYYSCNAM